MASNWSRNSGTSCAMLTEPPQNGGYLLAAYVVATVILVGYWGRLWLRARNLVRPSPPVRSPGQKEILPEYRGQQRPHDRPDPVDNVSHPLARHHGRAECSGRVHRGAGQWPANQNIEKKDQADAESTNPWSVR